MLFPMKIVFYIYFKIILISLNVIMFECQSEKKQIGIEGNSFGDISCKTREENMCKMCKIMLSCFSKQQQTNSIEKFLYGQSVWLCLTLKAFVNKLLKTQKSGN